MRRMLACAAMSTSSKQEVGLSHVDEQGRARMVSVSEKPETLRTAKACGRVRLRQSTLALILSGGLPKGDVLQVARLAGIVAAKKTADLIPLCHPIRMTQVSVDFSPQEAIRSDQGEDPEDAAIDIWATVTALDRTGVEMEALTAVSVAALTLYDMCKAKDRSMRITDIELVEKTGGRSGTYKKEGADVPAGDHKQM